MPGIDCRCFHRSPQCLPLLLIFHTHSQFSSLHIHVHTTSSAPLFGARKGNKMAEASSRSIFCNRQYSANTVAPLLCSQSCRSFCVASVGVKSRFWVKQLLYNISPARYFQFLPCLAFRWDARSSVTEAGKLLNLMLFSDENRINRLIYYKLHKIIINIVKHIYSSTY